MNPPFSFRISIALAAGSGFIALSYEILWTRLYSFMSGSRAEAFGAFLGCYLIGLAAGSLLSLRCQNTVENDDRSRNLMLSRLFIGANIAAFIVAPAVSWVAIAFDWLRSLGLVVLGSALLGTILPLLCHFSIPADQRSGARMSFVYVANIAGSGLGSLLTGFVLTDYLEFWQIQTLLLVLAAVIAWTLLRGTRPGLVDASLGVMAMALVASSQQLHTGFYERLMYKGYYGSYPRFTQIVETRHGVITVERDHTVYGGGVYDGCIDVQPRSGGGLFRPYFVSALHPAPRDILVIGMSAGSWTQILAHHPQAEHVTVVEISAGYIELIRTHAAVRSLLTNPKVQIAIDDGRRWLRRNPQRHFDLIVMNTTYYWREFASALLSKEFLSLAKEHLKEGGLVMWNCTGSARTVCTGLEVFPYTLMVGNNCVGSAQPILIAPERWATVLRSYVIDGKPVFDQTTAVGRRELADTLAFVDISGGDQSRIMMHAEMLQAFGREKIISDDNLGHEYELDLSTHPTLRRFLRATDGK